MGGTTAMGDDFQNVYYARGHTYTQREREREKKERKKRRKPQMLYRASLHIPTVFELALEWENTLLFLTIRVPHPRRKKKTDVGCKSLLFGPLRSHIPFFLGVTITLSCRAASHLCRLATKAFWLGGPRAMVRLYGGKLYVLQVCNGIYIYMEKVAVSGGGRGSITFVICLRDKLAKSKRHHHFFFLGCSCSFVPAISLPFPLSPRLLQWTVPGGLVRAHPSTCNTWACCLLDSYRPLSCLLVGTCFFLHIHT